VNERFVSAITISNDLKVLGMKRVLLVLKLKQPSPVGNVLENLRPLFSAPIRFKTLCIIATFLCSITVFAQPSNEQQQEAYKKVILERVVKIVKPLEISDSVKYNKTVQLVAAQYYFLNDVYEKDKLAVGDVKQQIQDVDARAAALKEQETKRSAILSQQHNSFIAQLKNDLSDEQIEKIKDGMTYRVLPITWAAYLDMLPRLTEEQKNKMYAWLREARELAMDAESSEKKHAVFGKYKGRINNYLSAAGYDMKKEGEEWQKRIKEREAKKKEPNS
jgi:hypothetical protein